MTKWKWLRALTLAAVITSLNSFPPRAKAHAVSPEQSRSASQDAGRASSEQSSSARQEAGGEEKDQNEQFKHSPSVRLIGRILKLDSQRSYWIATIINFAVIAGILGWAGRKVLPGWSRNRTAAIQKAMQEAQKASDEARRRLADIESRLMKLDVEIGMMRNTAEKEAGVEEARIQAAADEEARKIVAAAEQEIAAAAKAARRQLTAHAADLAVGLAQRQIHVDAPTDQALVRNFVGQLNTASDSSGKDGN